MADTFFSIDISESLIKVCDAKRSNNLIEITNIGYQQSVPSFYSIGSEKIIFDQAQVVSKLIADLKIKKRNVNIIIPDSITYSQISEMPRLNEKELLSAIKYQADQFIPMPLEETSIDIEILTEDKKNQKVIILMVAAGKSIISKIERLAEAVGLIPNSIENELSASAKCMVELFKQNTQNNSSIIINLGSSSTSLYLYDYKRSLIVQSHNFNIGYELFAKELKLNLNLDDVKNSQILKEIGFAQNTSYNIEEILSAAVKEFLKQIEKFIIVAKEKLNLPVDNIYLINEAININQLDKKIESYFQLPTGYLDLSPFLKKSTLVDSVKSNLPLFIPSLGGNFA